MSRTIGIYTGITGITLALLATLLLQWHQVGPSQFPLLDAAAGIVFGGSHSIGGTFRDCAHCPEMVVIPSGTFNMGSPTGEAGRQSDEGPQHRVNIRSIAVSKHEITFDQWSACVVGGGCTSNPNPDDGGWGRGDMPVINVSWNDVKSYVTWMNGRVGGNRYRLLSEAEWEFAARAGSTSQYFWGDVPGAGCAFANGTDQTTLWRTPQTGRWTISQCDDGASFTAKVGTYRANAFGLFDMTGNVWEWTQDCYHPSYTGAPTDGSAWTIGNCSLRINRGGSWLNAPPFLRSAFRGRGDPSFSSALLGFRLARTL